MSVRCESEVIPESRDTPEGLRKRIAELEAELVARDQFIAAIGHELRNPVSPVFLHLERLANAARQAKEGGVPASWLLPQLDAFSHRLQKFILVLDRILDVSRMRAGRVDLTFDEVDLSEVVRDIAASFERELAASRCSLSLSIAQPAVGTWDKLRLEQITYNLLSNAIRYGDSHPIEVSTSIDGEQARLTVRDHGVGIADEDQQRIFQRFESAEGGPKRQGFGVGLWIVKQLAQSMGGTVDLSSRLSEGTTLTVTLPRRRSAIAHD